MILTRDPSLVQKLSRTRMALKRCIRTDSRWNKNTPSRASLETAEILPPKSSIKRMADLLIGLRVSSTTGWNIKRQEYSYFETFLAAANSAAAPAVVADWWMYEPASVDVTVASHARAFLVCHGIKVMPSGLRMSPGKRPDGSLETGTPAEAQAWRWCRWVHGVAGCNPARACTQKHVHVDPMHRRPVHNGKNVEHRPLAPDVVLRPHELFRRPGASHTLQLQERIASNQCGEQ